MFYTLNGHVYVIIIVQNLSICIFLPTTFDAPTALLTIYYSAWALTDTVLGFISSQKYYTDKQQAFNTYLLQQSTQVCCDDLL